MGVTSLSKVGLFGGPIVNSLVKGRHIIANIQGRTEIIIIAALRKQFYGQVNEETQHFLSS